MSQNKKTILVVDDDEDILKFLQKILESAGFTVVSAPSPEEARKLIALAPPHLTISDLNMDPEDGYHFIQSFKRQKSYGDVPIIVLSAVNEFNTVKKVVALGIADYAIKPIQPPMLLRKIKKALHNKEFASWKPDADVATLLSITMDAEITELGETGYRIDGPFKLSPSKKLKVSSMEFREMGLEKYVHQSNNLMKSFKGGGIFSNDVTLVAINEEGASKIRKFAKKSTVND